MPDLMVTFLGQNSNFEISDKSGIDILIINESIAAMYQNQLLNLK